MELWKNKEIWENQTIQATQGNSRNSIDIQIVMDKGSDRPCNHGNSRKLGKIKQFKQLKAIQRIQ